MKEPQHKGVTDMSDPIAKGIELRRQLMGDEHIERMSAEDSGALQPWQDYIHANVWNGIWGRPGLPHRTRLLLNLAMLSALVRPNQLEMYIKVALNHGFAEEELVEIFLQTAMYAGAPAGVEAFACLKRALKAHHAKGTP
jgi:alkylhydroperoxidase/carboxymuconolactone decarboxylase family protein YurZ